MRINKNSFIRIFVELSGLEPKISEPKSDVLPLHHSSIRRSKAVQRYSKDFNIAKFFCPTSRVACERIAPATAGAIRSRSRGVRRAVWPEVSCRRPHLRRVRPCGFVCAGLFGQFVPNTLGGAVDGLLYGVGRPAQPRLGRPFDSCGLFVSAAGRPVDFVRQQIHRLFCLFGHSVDAGVDLFLVHCEECFFEERARSDAIQSRTTAPTTDAIRLPSVPTATSPSSDRIQPPRIPPTMPTIRLTTSPEPCPLTRRLASHPATSPISRYQRKYIVRK